MQGSQRNYPLYLGIGFSVVVVGIAIFGPALAPHDPLKEFGALTINGLHYGGPPLSRPVPPLLDPRFPLGTDLTMRDVLSRLLWALRPTLLLCAIVTAVRVGVGTLLGLLAGWFGGPVARVIDSVVSVSLAVPLLAVAVAVVLGFGFGTGVVPFVIALSLTGWCDTAALVTARTQAVRTAPYIESARAIGRRTQGLLWWHVLPQLRPLVPMLLAFEGASVLLLVAELGYLGYYIGGGAVFVFTVGNVDQQYLLRSGAPELGQMLSDFFSNLYHTPWIPLSAGGLVFLALAAFSLLGEGLRRELDVFRPRRVRWWQRLGRRASAAPGTERRRWAAVGGAALLLVIGTLLAARMLRHSSQQATSTVGEPRWSTMPVPAAQLSGVDLDALVRTPGVLPNTFSVMQIQRRVPAVVGQVPPPTTALAATLERNAAAAGDVTILLYLTRAQRDAAFTVLARPAAVDDFGGRIKIDVVHATPAIGEQANSSRRSEKIAGSFSNAEDALVFVRCAAVVRVRVAGTTPADLADAAATIATTLDEQLAPHVCQP